MNQASTFARSLCLALGAAALTLLAACSALKPTPVPPPAFYALDAAPAVVSAVSAMPAGSRGATSGPAAAPTLVVNPPLAVAGFDSQRIIFLRQAHQLEYFAYSEWVDTPARMLAPLIVAALDRSGKFRAVLATPSAAAGELRLDTEIVRLQHEFGATPSRVRLTLRATLRDNATRQVLAQIELDHRADAPSADAYGGVIAANHATQAMLQDLAAFCSRAAGLWQAREGGAGKGTLGRL